MASIHPNSNPPLFVGEFRHAIDGKSRITIPSQWRFEDATELSLRPSADLRCLKVMPRGEINRIRAVAAELPGPQRIHVLRELGSGTRQCALDKAGRLVLPEDFCKSLNLSGEVALVGAMETFEIWNLQAWAEVGPKSAALANAHLLEFGL